jgi:nitroreductase
MTHAERTAPDHHDRDVLHEAALSALAQRYRRDPGEATLPWNDVLATLLGHRSVRAYRPDPVPPSVLAMAIAAAQSAPTSSNLQVWSVVAIEGQATKARLADLAGGQRHIKDCPLFLVWLADLSRLRVLGTERGRPTAGLDYLEGLLLGVVDATLAAQNAVVALESLGYGTVYIGGMRDRPEEVAETLGLPADVVAVFGLCLGRPDDERPAAVKPRLPVEAVLHRERFGDPMPADLVAGYDQALKTFQAEQRMAETGWSDTALHRVRGPEALNGRHRLREAIAKRGFPMK